MNNIVYSIIIPTRNNHSELKLCLNTLQSYLSKFPEVEVIVVDNNDIYKKPDNPVANGIINIHSEIVGRSAARNYGALHAKGTWLIFLDSDCLLYEINFQKFISKVKEKAEIFSIFQVMILNADQDLNPKPMMFGYTRTPKLDSFRDKINVKDIPNLDSACFAIKRELFNKLGGFDLEFERFEDRLLGFKAFLNNVFIYNCLDVRVKKIHSENGRFHNFKKLWSEIRYQSLAEYKQPWAPIHKQRERNRNHDFVSFLIILFWTTVRKILNKKYDYKVSKASDMTFSLNEWIYIVDDTQYKAYLTKNLLLSFFRLIDAEVIMVEEKLSSLMLSSTVKKINVEDRDLDNLLFYLCSRKILKRIPGNPT